MPGGGREPVRFDTEKQRAINNTPPLSGIDTPFSELYLSKNQSINLLKLTAMPFEVFFDSFRFKKIFFGDRSGKIGTELTHTDN
jgi:hypothetical protein